jgi:hypothetical protein
LACDDGGVDFSRAVSYRGAPPPFPRENVLICARVLAQHGEHFRVIKRIAPASDDGQQFLVGAEPFQGDVKLVGDLRREVSRRRLLVDDAGGLFPSASPSWATRGR